MSITAFQIQRSFTVLSDKTLSLEGAAADAKVVGEEISGIKSAARNYGNNIKEYENLIVRFYCLVTNLIVVIVG